MAANDTSDLTLLVGRIDGKLDLLLESRGAQEAHIAAHNDRLVALEAWRNKLIGAVAILASTTAYMAHVPITSALSLLFR